MSEIISETPQPAEPPRNHAFRLPADYYSSPASEVRPLFPRWVPIGCGTVAAAVLVIAFGAGAVIARIGVGPLMDKVLASMEVELHSLYGKDVSPGERKALDDQFALLRKNVASERVPVAQLDPVISEIRTTSADKVIDAREAAKLTETIRQVNEAKSGAKPPSAPSKR